MTNRDPVIILWDLETIPNLTAALENWPRMWDGAGLNADMSTIVCFGYQYLSGGPPECTSAWDYPEWAKNVNNDKAVAQFAYKILSQADAIVAHYGNKFDVKFLNARLAFHGLPPLPPIATIDTYSVAKQKFKLRSKSLDSLAKFFGLKGKMH